MRGKLLKTKTIRVLTVSLAALLLAVCACSSAMAIIYGDYAYTIANGQATITGCSGYGGGPDWDYLDEEEGNPERPGKWDESARFPQFIDGVWRMVIPDTLEGYPVVAIGDGAFYEAGRFHDAIIPEGVVSIGDQAFLSCYNLGALTIPASVTSIGEDAFEGTEGFGYTVLRVTEGSYAAQYARENGIPYTYDAQFKFIESAKWLYTLADDTATIYGFRGQRDDDGNVIIPDRLDGHPVTAIEYGAWVNGFCRSGLTGVIIPQSVVSIGDEVFSECDALSCVIFPEGIMSIGNSVFDGCESLTSAAIPASCTSIGERAFENCPNLILKVKEGSYAEQYARENGIPYVAATGARFEEKATIISDLTVNIRSGPGTQYAQIGEAYPGASFYYTGITINGFLEIVYPDIDFIHVLAYVNKDLAEVSRVNAGDAVYSSVAGYLRVKPKTQVYFDALLSKKTKQTLGSGEDVPFAGVSSSGSYAVLYTTVNRKEELLLWIGYVSPKDVVEVNALGE